MVKFLPHFLCKFNREKLNFIGDKQWNSRVGDEVGLSDQSVSYDGSCVQIKTLDWFADGSRRVLLQVPDSKVAVQVNARAVGAASAVARPIVWNLGRYILQKEDESKSDDDWFHDENSWKSEKNLMIEPVEKCFIYPKSSI